MPTPAGPPIWGDDLRWGEYTRTQIALQDKIWSKVPCLQCPETLNLPCQLALVPTMVSGQSLLETLSG